MIVTILFVIIQVSSRLPQQQTPIERQTSCQIVQKGCNFIAWQKGCQFGRILPYFSVENYHMLISVLRKNTTFAGENRNSLYLVTNILWKETILILKTWTSRHCSANYYFPLYWA